MASLKELNHANQELYEELRENLLALRQDEDKKKAFVRKVGEFLDAIHETGSQANSVEEYEWLNRANVNWHSAITTVLGVPMDIKSVPLPKLMVGYEPRPEATPLTPEFERLPLEVLIELSRKALAKTPGSSSQEQLQEFVAELQRIGYRVDKQYSDYIRSMLEAAKNIFDLQKKIDIVKEILEASEHFVIDRHGVWDDHEWANYLKSLEEKGFTISKEHLSYYGDVIEAMKEIYCTATKTKKANEILNELTAHTVTFLADEKAVWDHSAWKEFVKAQQGLGLQMSEEQTAYLGNLLEAGKRLYFAAFGIKSHVQ